LQHNGNGDGSSFRGKLLGFGPLQPWEFDANCFGTDQAIFFGDDWDDAPRSKHSSHRTKKQTAEALALCASCPVLAECREWGIVSGIPYGIVGGLTEPQRLRERRQRGINNGVGRKPKRPTAKPVMNVPTGSLRQTLPDMASGIGRWSTFQGSTNGY
jgi:WhiB family redox-sensing transcriptional regulator